MKTYINLHQLEKIVLELKKEYETFGPKNVDGKVIFDFIEKPSELKLFPEQTIIPFKKIIFPNKQLIGDFKNRKIALLGLNNCDIWAFIRFYDQFEKTDFLPLKNNVFIIGQECYPDEFCFCDMMGVDKFAPFDIYLQKEKNLFSVFSGSKKGENILKLSHIKEGAKIPVQRKIEPPEKGQKIPENISEIIEDRGNHKEFWQNIADNCFGCGACTAVCPLCFCTRQSFKSNLDGLSNRCFLWDSCFAKEFSEVQNHFDLRPENSDRLYNWYHHKFVRSFLGRKYFLCTGCGRCIKACPAHLNIKNILESLLNKEE